MFKELFGDKLVSKDGDVNTEEALAGLEAVGIYFSAHWCPPCRGFTPVFAKKYNELKEAGKKFQTVFASSDQDQEACKSYFADMPWLCLPYAERALKETLAKKYGCNGIPYLVILDGKTGEVITKNGRAGITGKNHIEDFPYHPKAMYDTGESMDGVEDGHSFMLVQNYADEDTKKANSAVLLDIAKNQKDLFNKFFTVNTSEGPTRFIRTQTGQEFFFGKPDFELTLTKNKKCLYEFYGCNRCGEMSEHDERYHNSEHDYDLCLDCWAKGFETPSEADKVPVMVVIDVVSNSYMKPAKGFEGFSKENVEKFAQDVKKGEAKKVSLGEKA